MSTLVETALLEELAHDARRARESARIYGTTKVGAVALADDGRRFSGCNIEHRFRSHDVHAEVCALAALVAGSATRAKCIVIAADRTLFTPCGSCMDWIYEIGGPDCLVCFAPDEGQLRTWRAAELMPFYPED